MNNDDYVSLSDFVYKTMTYGKVGPGDVYSVANYFKQTFESDYKGAFVTASGFGLGMASGAFF